MKYYQEEDAMNAVGTFGKFIIQYQNEIEIVLAAVIFIAAAAALIRAAVNAKKKRQLLSEINDAVSEINSAVSSLNEKNSGVIYIDNRSGSGPAAGSGEVSVREAVLDAAGLTGGTPADGEDGAKEAAGEEQNPAAEGKSCEETKPQDETQPQDEPQPEIPKKYFSRDCSVSKNGKTYTLEELERQIKE